MSVHGVRLCVCVAHTSNMDYGKPCWECQRMKLLIVCIQYWLSQDVPKSTPYKYLSMRCMAELLWKKDCHINDLKLISLNCQCKVGTLTASTLGYKQFAMAISQCDAPHINVLVQSALWKKHGVREIIQLLTKATLGLFRRGTLDEYCAVSARGLRSCWVCTNCPWNPRPIYHLKILYNLNTCVLHCPKIGWAKQKYSVSLWAWHPIRRQCNGAYLYVQWDQSRGRVGLVSLDQLHHWAMLRTLRPQPIYLQQPGWCPICMWRLARGAHPPWGQR